MKRHLLKGYCEVIPEGQGTSGPKKAKRLYSHYGNLERNITND